ncbi:MAG: carbohydrate ABC transporter substrate-binding protein [Christensenellaceae bacterium]|nr:carbohydrate ABC transporter substrate-binding protein [Christensenellaceae bacterium]
MKKLLSLVLVLAMALSIALTFANAEETKTVVYWSMWEATEPQGVVLQQAADAYAAATGVKVEIQFKGRTGIREGLEPALQAGTVIDIFDEDVDRVNGTFAQYLLDLEELAKEANYEETAMPALVATARNVAGGTLKSIPYQPNVFNIFYNKAIFEEVGVTEVPQTWVEFLNACEKIKAGGYIPLTSDDAYIVSNFGYHLARHIGEEGVIKVVKEGLFAEEPAVLKVAQAYEELFQKGYLSPTMGSNVWPTAQIQEIGMDEAAMYLNGSWLPNEILGTTGPEFQWGCMAYPAVEGGVDGTEAANYGAQVFAINNKSEVAKEAFDLIMYFVTGEYDALLSKESVGIPSDVRNEEWPEMLLGVKDVLATLTTRYSWSAGAEANPNITPAIKENMQKLVSGSIDAQGFVDALEAAFN